MSKIEKVHKILTNLSLQDAHIEFNISFMSAYCGCYCAKFDICSFIADKKMITWGVPEKHFPFLEYGGRDNGKRKKS